MRDVVLSPGIPGGKWARLRPLCGHDEILVDPSGSVDRIAFIDRLITEASGTAVKPGRAAELAVCDCDRLCASVYLDYFGETIEGQVACKTCRERFDMSFLLPALLQDLAESSRTFDEPDEAGVFTSPDGWRFRLPTAGEQQEVAGMPSEAAIAVLLDKCVLSESPISSPQAIERAMEQAGPVLDLDLAAVCPHCGETQTVRFDIQSYLFRALGYEKQFLLYEVHRIAAAYGWSYDATLGLTRNDRRQLVQLIESERSAQRRSRS